MRLCALEIRNFRCFGEEPTRVEFASELTALIGANGTGKTALLIALARLFGVTQAQRTVLSSDFHVAAQSTPDDTSRELSIEAFLEFPELETDDESAAIPAAFNNMIVESPGASPYCRVRLEATWTNDGTVEGAVEQRLFWVLTSEDPPPDDKKKPMSPADRGLIQVHYIPATRDPSAEIRYTASSRAGRVLRAVAWSEGARAAVKDGASSIQEALEAEEAVNAINTALQSRWGELNDERLAREVGLRFTQNQLEEAIRAFSVSFRPEDAEAEHDLSRLSEGQQSLFYLALAAMVLDLESKLSHGNAENELFLAERLRPPVLTIFALEEPENHLAPHLLGRVVKLARSLSTTGAAQSVFSSHSPSILSRVLPEEVRHFRLRPEDGTSTVNPITLPARASEAFKYVQEAVMAFPELYFSRFVLLGEGPSEGLILPRLFKELALDLDTSSISFVPLGGRHVNHFWRLLSDLGIPHATLLDLDWGRPGGGWGRIKYALNQLLLIGHEQDKVLKFKTEEVEIELSSEELERFHAKAITQDLTERRAYLAHLESFGVFFSSPLDIDFLMLGSYPEEYCQPQEGGTGPGIPIEESELELYLDEAISTVVGSDTAGRDYYKEQSREAKMLFPWYRYHFLSRGKPGSHLEVMLGIDVATLKKRCPSVFKRLLAYCRASLPQ